MIAERTVYTLRIDRREVRLRPTSIGIQVRLERGTVIASPGAPALPVRMVPIALPTGHTARSVSARVLSVESLTGANARVVPADDLEGVDSPLEAPRLRSASPDPEAYARAAQRGRQHPARLVGTSKLGEVPVVTVVVQAVRFGPDGELELIREIEITVEHEAAAVRAARRPDAFILRQHALARTLVVNPAQVDAAPHPERFPAPPSDQKPLDEGLMDGLGAYGRGYLPAEIDYLIVTDDRRWGEKVNPSDPDAIDDPASDPNPPGDLSTAFEYLAETKRDRGYRVAIVKLSAVVAGAYGDYSTGRRDVQETLRDFLKAVVESRGVQYVLLGGDHSIIPPRLFCGSSLKKGGLEKKTFADNTQPGDLNNASFPKGSHTWLDGTLIMHIDPQKLPSNGEQRVLTMYRSGQLVPHKAQGGATPYWKYCTNDYTTGAPTDTEYVRAEGLPGDDKPLWYARGATLIPSDLYYASLYGEMYNQPGKHDWDQLNNGLYGQWYVDEDDVTRDIGGGDCHRDVHLGRAPVCNLDEANDFVNKVLGYETSAARPETWERFDRMVIAASNFETYDFMNRKIDADGNPVDYDPEVIPEYHEYVYDESHHRSVLRATDAFTPPLGKLYAYPASESSMEDVLASQRVLIDYDPLPGPGKTRWHFAVSYTNLLASEERTEWVVVYSDDSAVLMPEAFGYDVTDEVDSSIGEGEAIFALMQGNFLHGDGAEIHRLYTDDSAVPQQAGLLRLTYDSLKAYLSTGPNLFTMSGHGGPTKVSKFLDTDMVSLLTNTNAPFVAYVNSCHTGAFDSDDCLGEMLVTVPYTGAVAYMGFSRVSWRGEAAELHVAFFEALCTERHLGVVFDNMGLFVAPTYAPTSSYRWNLYAHNLFGDPEMLVYRDKDDLLPVYIGNRQSKELHRRDCLWVERMWVGHQIRFDTLEEGLQAKYDGCYYCLREHHTR